MDDKALLVLKGFKNLNDTQKKEVLAEIDNLQKRGTFTESTVTKIGMGPLGQGCPCCGRS